MRKLLVLVIAVVGLSALAGWRADPAAPGSCRYPKVAAQVDRFLARVGSPAAGQGCVMAEEAIRHGWHPAFFVAVAGTESSYWHAACSNNPKNGWGLAACDGRWHVPYFHTWRQAFRFYAQFLAGKTSVTRGWPSADSPYDFGGYAACTSCWAAKTSMHLARVGGTVRWPWGR